MKDEAKGKVESITETTRSNKRLSNKLERENKQRQLRKAKTMALLEKRRKTAFSDAPILVLLVPFTASADVHLLHQWILTSSVVNAQRSMQPNNDYVLIKGNQDEVCTRWNLLSVDMEDLSKVSDWLKVADVVVPVFYGDELGEEFGPTSYCLEVLRTMGVSRLIPVAMFPEKKARDESLPLKQHEMNEMRKHRAQFLVDQSVAEEPEQVRPISISQQGQVQQLIRSIATKTPRRPKWRDSRSYLLGDSYQWFDRNVLKVVGYIRGKPWLCKRLVYLAGIGSFQPVKICIQKEPCPKKSSHKKMEEDGEEKVVLEAVPGDPSFDSPKPYFEETERDEEMQDSEDYFSESLENNDTSSECSSLEQDDYFEEPADVNHHLQQADTQSFSDEAMSDDNQEMELVVDDDHHHHNDDDDDHSVVDKEELEKLRNEMKDELLFPDERDTPLDQPARERFRKYRGLASLANSEWDNADQELPLEYKRIFQFANFVAFRKKHLELEDKLLQDTNNKIDSGMYVAFYLHVEESDRDFIATLVEQHVGGRPLVAVCLHPHEHRYSVIHFRMKRTLLDYQLQEEEENTSTADDVFTDKLPNSATSVVKSKDLLEMHCGFFKYLARPVFSLIVNRSNKLKYIKFLPNHQNIVASVYGPCVYPPAPLLVVQPTQGGHLLAQGSILGIDTNRVILKRIVLSGFPYRVFKSKAVVRYMFFNREDILWFQPCPLWTKRGRLGNIVEPVGTHGYMKCRFNGHLKAQDTVCLSIYKRVFPKWVTKEEYLQHPLH